MTNVQELSLEKLLKHAHIGVVIHRWDTSIVYANPTACKLLRLTYDQLIGKDAFDPQWCFLDDAGKKLVVEDFPVNKVRRRKKPIENETIGVIDSSSDEISWFLINAYFEDQNSTQNDGFIIVTFNDITESKNLFSFQSILENTQDIVIVTEANGIDYPADPKIVYVNAAFESLTGYKCEDVIGETPRILQGPLTDKEAKKRIYNALKSNQAVTETLLNYDVRGRPYWIEMNIVPLKNKYGEITHFAAIERDVSERRFHLEQLEQRNKDLKALRDNLEQLVENRTNELKKAKMELEKVAFYDPLTNIPNRRHFIDQVHKMVSYASRKNLHMVFGLLDIDDFKCVNDSHGHDAGDAVLKAIANFLRGFFRTEDAICRYGGEEFSFVLALDNPADLDAILNRLLAGINEIEVTTSSSVNLKVTASIGIKVRAEAKNIDLDHEMKQADVALYQSKSDGKNRYTIIRS